ncbi:hypothetical protein AVEN_193196-1 [Araneus ventricosus]|uniref:Uncharacterized protein n=1 Tax=Araneus ventricosus TaxID=182803 RepID=A0A4Y2B080_ARAVE|nr:hypothetical protein AVEN_193196-1 [Araneus ventricosus]
MVNITSWAKCPPTGMVQKLRVEVPAQVPFSSSDRGSKLGLRTQNSPYIGTRRDVNITKLSEVHTQFPQKAVIHYYQAQDALRCSYDILFVFLNAIPISTRYSTMSARFCYNILKAAEDRKDIV